MDTRGSENRRRILQAADELFYRQGFTRTSFSDIAERAGVPRGNFYYYFKSKDILLQDVVDYRKVQWLGHLEHVNRLFKHPKERLLAFAAMPMDIKQSLLRYGCPVGSLTMELGKSDALLQRKAAELFDVVAQWLCRQLEAMGVVEETKTLAMRLIARMQGVFLVASVYDDDQFLRTEINRIKQWIEELSNDA